MFCWHAVHPRKGYARSLAEMLDEALREDLGQDAYDAGGEDDSAMVNKLRSNVSAHRYGIDISPAVGGGNME